MKENIEFNNLIKGLVKTLKVLINLAECTLYTFNYFDNVLVHDIRTLNF